VGRGWDHERTATLTGQRAGGDNAGDRHDPMSYGPEWACLDEKLLPSPLPCDIACAIQLADRPGLDAGGRRRAGWRQTRAAERAAHLAELAIPDRRMAQIHCTIALSALAALRICIVIILLFTGRLAPSPLTEAVGVLFVVRGSGVHFT
jgi:hypothetical protein